VKLRNWLKREKLTQEQFAKKIGISRSHLANIVGGKRRPDWPKLCNHIIALTGGEVTTRDLRPDIVKEILDSKDVSKDLRREMRKTRAA